MKKDSALIKTLSEKCKVCYTCVRDCPAKAIRITGGQAEVISDRCIGCGNCVRVCSQKAKQCYDSIGEVEEILGSDCIKIAIIAPSFPAEFTELDHIHLIPMIKELGFDLVSEVAFGADIVANEYKKLVSVKSNRRFIATTCPAIVAYIEKYHPKLVKNLAPIASPMITAAKVMKKLHGQDSKVVFIGPCIAKKAEAVRNRSETPDVDAALTFFELRKMINAKGLKPDPLRISDFDAPHPGLGALFSLSGGMLQAANMKEDLLNSQIIAADGQNNFVEAINEFENGAFDAKLLEVLCCNGCIRGSGMSNDIPYFSRRTAVSNYVRKRIENTKEEDRNKFYDYVMKDIDISTDFETNDHRLPLPSRDEIDQILGRMGKYKPEDELDCGACGYQTCREHAIAIHKGLAESEMCLPNTIELLKKSLDDLQVSNDQLEQTKEALFSAEKLASMGQLSAGIAHEINNPLGVILLNSNLMLDEFEKESENYEDLKLIVEQAERCKKIVAGLLNFARKNKVVLQPTNICELVDQCLRAIVKKNNIDIDVKYTITEPILDLDNDQIIQVLTNLIVNAMEAMPDGCGGKICIGISDKDEGGLITITDNGAGISEDNIGKIFEPLFTTKQMGKGTGLGLAVTYGIIKMHKGNISVESNQDPEKGPVGTVFKVFLPRKALEL